MGLCPPRCDPICQATGIGCICAGNLKEYIMPYVCEEADPAIPSLNRDVLNIMAVLANVVQAGKRILQLGANRAQCLVAFQEYLFQEHGPEGPTLTMRMHSPSELSTP